MKAGDRLGGNQPVMLVSQIPEALYPPGRFEALGIQVLPGVQVGIQGLAVLLP